MQKGVGRSQFYYIGSSNMTPGKMKLTETREYSIFFRHLCLLFVSCVTNARCPKFLIRWESIINPLKLSDLCWMKLIENSIHIVTTYHLANPNAGTIKWWEVEEQILNLRISIHWPAGMWVLFFVYLFALLSGGAHRAPIGWESLSVSSAKLSTFKQESNISPAVGTLPPS